MAINLNHPTNTIDGTSVLNVNSGDGENIELNPDSGLVNVNGNINIAGNFTVQGTTTTINSTTSSIVDPIILLGTDENGDPAATVDSKDRGVAFYYNDGAGNKTGFLGYDRGTGYFRFVPDAEITGEIVSGSDGTIKIDTLESTTINTVDLNVSNDTGITGDLTIGGNLAVPTSDIGDLNFSTNIITSDGSLDIVLNSSSGYIDVSNNTIKNLLDPTNSQDAATKNYVDAAINDNTNLSLAADTGTGTINLATETLTINGTNFQVETSVIGNVITITLPTNMTVPGNLNVTTDLAVTGTSTFTGTITAGDIDSATLDTTGNVTVGGTLDVTSTSNFQNDVTVQTNLHVLGNTDIDGDLNVDGNITLGGNITIGDQTLDTVTVVADFTSNLIPDVDSTYDIGETLKRWRTLYADNIDVNDLLINDTLTVTGDTTLNSNLLVDGDTSLTGTLGVSGATSIANTLGVLDAVSFDSSLDVYGSTTLHSTLVVTGTTTLNDDVSALSNMTVSGSLNVIQDATVGTTLNVIQDATVGGTLQVIQDTTLSGNLQVIQDTTLSGNLQVIQDTTISGELTVYQPTTLNNTLSVTDNATFSSDVSITGNLNVMGTLTSINTADTTIKDNFITLNDGETEAGVTAGYSGIEIDRGSEPNALLWWNEGNDFWEVGVGESYANLAANNLYLAGSAIVEGSITSASLTASNLTETRVVLAGVDGQLIDSDKLTFTGTGMYLRNDLYINEGNNIIASGNIDVVGEVTAANVTVTTLDEDSIPFADANGRLVDSPSLTFDVVTALLSVPNISASNQIYAVTIKDEHLTPGRITFAGSGKELVDSELLTFDAASGALTVDGLTFDNTTISAVDGDIVLDPGIYNIDVSDSRITNVADPVDPQDVTTKSYVLDTIEANSNLAVVGDSGSTNVNLATEQLAINGTVNQIITVSANQSVTLSLPNDFIVPDRLTVIGPTEVTTITSTDIAMLDSAIVYNNLTVEGSTIIEGDTTILGNLTVQGTLTSVETDNTVITDNIITLNQGETGAGVTLGYSGIEVDRGSEDITRFQWNEALDRWEVVEGTSLTNFAALEVQAGDLNISGNTITSTQPNGDVVINSTGSGQVIVNGEPVVTGLDSIVYAIVFGG